MLESLPVEVTAEILPGKPDPAATARFANADRAVQYGQILATDPSYVGGVWVTTGTSRHRLTP